MRSAFILITLLYFLSAKSQNISQKLDLAFQKLALDSQVKHALISMFVIESNSGKVVFEKNAETGMAPASCQKVVTSAAAFELLGKNYTYKTSLAYAGYISNDNLKGKLFIIGSGDPTLGSWRYASTTEEVLLSKFTDAIKKQGIKNISEGILAINPWGVHVFPDGWIWQDLGNYYGAGASGLNWRENQFDIVLRSGRIVGESVLIYSIHPSFGTDPWLNFINHIKTAEKGSGDNAYIYLPIGSTSAYLEGTIPVNEERFTISGSLPNPGNQLACDLYNKLVSDHANPIPPKHQGLPIKITHHPPTFAPSVFYEHTSPPLDSINYWFLKKSINLYGEALIKTIGLMKANNPSTDSGVSVVRNFWSTKGIEKSSLKIIDGSGLSPGSRVTTKALVNVMQYARNQPWFSSFLYDLPDLNGIKMKDGYINGVRSYTGYIKSKNGMEYTFSFIINNFDGSASKIREKMWNVLDILKNENAKL